jgi:hypothetical protein
VARWTPVGFRTGVQACVRRGRGGGPGWGAGERGGEVSEAYGEDEDDRSHV